MEFTISDGIVAGIIVLSSLLAYSRGFVREALAITGWIVAAIAAYVFAPQARPLIAEIPLVSDLLDNCATATIGAFAGVFAVCLVVFALFAPLFSAVIQRSALNALDQGLGFFFGAIRGILLVAVALVVYDFVAGSEAFAFIDTSRSAQLFASVKTQMAGDIADQDTALQWLEDRFEGLMQTSCGTMPGTQGT
jgi:membrane protein required for colicin V production